MERKEERSKEKPKIVTKYSEFVDDRI